MNPPPYFGVMFEKFLALFRHRDWRAYPRKNGLVMRRWDNGWEERPATPEEEAEYVSRDAW